MDVQNYIPKNKGDQTVIKRLKELSFEQIKPIIPQLLEWLQDANWPIARPVSEVLIPFVDKITPDIIQIFKTNDGLWKLWTLTLLANKSTDPLLLKEITRIAEHPTKDEIGEEANLAAIEILNNKNIQSR